MKTNVGMVLTNHEKWWEQGGAYAAKTDNDT